MIRDSKDNSLRNFPADMLMMSGLPLIAAAVLMQLLFVYPRTVAIAALAVACIGAGLLFWAKLPLYRAGIYCSFGPQAIPQSHRAFYYWGMCLAAGGCALTALLIPLLRIL